MYYIPFKISAKIVSLFMPLIIAFNAISYDATAMSKSVSLEYRFANSNQLSAAGVVEVTSKIDGDYDLYWGDEDGKKLTVDVNGYTATYSEIVSVDVDHGEGESEIYSYTAIPDGAETVLVYHGPVLKCVSKLPDSKIHEVTETTYTFGALSDLHFNRYHYSLGDDAMLSFPNALNFLKSFDVSLVAMSGDLSNDSERNAFEKFNHVASQYSFPVLTCSGNHDVHHNFNKEDWFELINTGVYNGPTLEGVSDVHDMDFVYAPESLNGDVFIFLSQYQWSYNSEDSELLRPDQLDWLEKEFEKYQDRRVYLFFHTFVADNENNPNKGEGNLINSKGVYYNLCYTVGTSDEIRFKSLLKEYKNVIYFNGHSHWKFDMMEFNPRLNITDYNGEYCTMVHIPSVSSSRSVTDKSTSRKEYPYQSEGYLVKVYDDHVVLQGINFYKAQMISCATYLIEK